MENLRALWLNHRLGLLYGALWALAPMIIREQIPLFNYDNGPDDFKRLPMEWGGCFVMLIASLPTGADGAPELWKLNHYYERLDQWHAERDVPTTAGAPAAAEPALELHNLTIDPEERNNLSTDAPATFSEMRTVLEAQREEKRLLPSIGAPTP
jgi:hypothetical protein